MADAVRGEESAPNNSRRKLLLGRSLLGRRGFAIWAAIAVAFIVLLSVRLGNWKPRSAVCIVPYTSGAANYEWGGGWRINQQAIADFEHLSTEQQMKLRAAKVGEQQLQPFGVMLDRGYLYIILVARTFFWSLGDLEAVIWLQIFAHATICCWILHLLEKPRQRLIFLLLYALNPLVLWIVTLPYYYFWQAFASTVFVSLLLARRPISTVQMTVATGLLLGVYWIRPSTLLLSSCCFVLALVRCWSWPRLAFPCIFAIAAILGPRQAKTPEHTIYVGLGAYPNPDAIEPTDAAAFALHERATGEAISTEPGGNFYSTEYWKRYARSLRPEIIRFLRVHPILVLRNAVLNTLQGFSLGYVTNRPFGVHVAMAACGLVIAVVLAITKQWWILAANLANVCVFTPYYPPIPAYMFGSYLILTIGGVAAVESILARRSGRSANEPTECAASMPPSGRLNSADDGTALADGSKPFS